MLGCALNPLVTHCLDVPEFGGTLWAVPGQKDREGKVDGVSGSDTASSRQCRRVGGCRTSDEFSSKCAAAGLRNGHWSH